MQNFFQMVIFSVIGKIIQRQEGSPPYVVHDAF